MQIASFIADAETEIMCKGQLGILHMLKDFEVNDLYKAEGFLNECHQKLLVNNMKPGGSGIGESPKLKNPRMNSTSPLRSPKKIKTSNKKQAPPSPSRGTA